ncbi:hypothetical protein [Leptolyngbya sp. 7M]|uniref:hypothetical protein n=1 Tax=Leptolyngbya sp. 7M TaxID=2812896 RepID=UPI001B8BE454|nr:hypothetical protein [Leptolyngbya sp. 7M]QYO64158.1 hypothetical protein JVX88_31120 [Leptolyngbya sp. 7M]
MSKAITTFLTDSLIYGLSFGLNFSLTVLLISACQSFYGFLTAPASIGDSESFDSTSNSDSAPNYVDSSYFEPMDRLGAKITAAIPSAQSPQTGTQNPQQMGHNSSELEQHRPDQTEYHQEQNRFSFAYPDDFVVDARQPGLTSSADTPEMTLELWQRSKYDAIQAGAYADGAEPPPNVQIAVYRNPQRLALMDWIGRSNRFVQSGDFQSQMVAGQEAIAFRSSGLYEHENVVFSNTDGTEVMVISLAKVGIDSIDAPNQRAFEQVLATFTPW